MVVVVRALPDCPTEAFVMSTRHASTRRRRRTSVVRGVGNTTETERGSTNTPPGKTGETSTGRGGGWFVAGGFCLGRLSTRLLNCLLVSLIF